MGGGRHRRQNPRGSPTGKKERGDRGAEKVHGRKGMYKEQREKGQSHTKITSTKVASDPLLDDNEWQIMWLLFTKKKYKSPGLSWEDLQQEISVIKVTDDPTETDEFMQDLKKKVRSWLVYVPFHEVYLEKKYSGEIASYLKRFLKAKNAE